MMGEEGAVGGTARYVDSSLERLQVKVSGFNAERYLVACNGHRVPLASTGTAGEYAGGVRFRAWKSAVIAASDDRGGRAAHIRSV